MLEFYRQVIYKAKKQHLCDYCGKPIIPGSYYLYETGKYDGEFFTAKFHNSDCYDNFYNDRQKGINFNV